MSVSNMLNVQSNGLDCRTFFHMSWSKLLVTISADYFESKLSTLWGGGHVPQTSFHWSISFDTMPAMKLIGKLNTLDFNPTFWNWILGFFANTLTAEFGSHTSSTLVLNTPKLK